MYYVEICKFLGVINDFPLFTENLLAARKLPNTKTLRSCLRRVCFAYYVMYGKIFYASSFFAVNSFFKQLNATSTPSTIRRIATMN